MFKSIQIAIVFIFLTTGLEFAHAKQSCASIFDEGLASQFRNSQNLSSWEGRNFSDPQFHNSQAFRYRIHMISRKVYDLTNGARNSSENATVIEEIFRYFAESVVPDKNIVVSTSVIDQDHRASYGDYGFILDIPPENIIATSSRDVGAPGAELLRDERPGYKDLAMSLLKISVKKNPVRSPEEILDGSTDEHNEIVVVPKDKTEIRIIGIIFKNTGESAGDRRAMEELAKHNNLPFVFIEQ